MRVSSEDIDVIQFIDVEPGSRAALTALGRLLSTTPMRLVPGCPLMIWVKGAGVPDVNWRMSYPPSTDSLWSNFLFLQSLYGEDENTDLYDQLESLRAKAASDTL